MPKAMDSNPIPHKPEIVACAYNPSNQRLEAGRAEFQSQLWLHSKFWATYNLYEQTKLFKLLFCCDYSPRTWEENEVGGSEFQAYLQPYILLHTANSKPAWDSGIPKTL